MKQRKGMVPVVVLTGFAVFAIMLFILPLIVGNVRLALEPTLNSLNDSAINSSVSNTQTQFNNAINLLVVALIVGAASIIILVASGIGGGYRR